jgi:hypothetical protein
VGDAPKQRRKQRLKYDASGRCELPFLSLPRTIDIWMKKRNPDCDRNGIEVVVDGGIAVVRYRRSDPDI